MTEPHRPRVKYVIGPDGSPLTIADLPAPGTKRWVIRRKAEVVAAVRGGLLSLEEACSRYTLTATGKDSSGNNVAISTEVQGVVDSVDLSASPPLLSIGGQSYTTDKIKRVVRPATST